MYVPHVDVPDKRTMMSFSVESNMNTFSSDEDFFRNILSGEPKIGYWY